MSARGKPGGDSDPEKPDQGPAVSVLIGALLLALPLYFLTLEWWYSRERSTGRRWGKLSRAADNGTDGGSGGAVGLEMARTPDSLDFREAPIPNPAGSKEEYLRHLICFARLDDAYAPRSLYLRSKSFERFTNDGVESQLREESGGGPPDFALMLESPGTSAVAEGRKPQDGGVRGYLTFLKNFEAMLPHPPMLRRLAGPQEYVACRDGAIRFPASIAAGDEYEVEFLPQRFLRPDSVVASVSADSPYLDPGPFDSADLRTMAEEAARSAPVLATAQRVLAMAAHLEKTCTYSERPAQVHPGSPVLTSFLTGDRVGHCQHISSAMVLFCRLQGVPARVAGGLVATRDPAGGPYLFSDVSPHAWAEILTESGWAICEIAPSRKRIDNNSSPACPLPDVRDLAAATEKARRENRELGGGTHEKSGEEVVPGGSPGQSDNGPTRIANRDWPGRANPGAARPAATPGSISGDREKMRRAIEEWKRLTDQRISRIRWGRFWHGLFAAVFAFMIILGWRFRLLERFAVGLLRLLVRTWKTLFQPERGADAEDRRQAAQDLEKLAEELQPGNEASLKGMDVVRLFNRFVEVMGAGTEIPRQGPETVGEYFARLGPRFCLDDRCRDFLSKTFAAALYGRKKIVPEEARRFREELRRVLREAARVVREPPS